MMGSWESEARLRAVRKNGDRAFWAFFEGLQHRKLLVTRCPTCRTSHFPPRPFCPDCLNQQFESAQHEGMGRVYAFTSLADAHSSGSAVTYAMVELEGVEGRIFTRVDAPYEEMAIGMEVEVDYLEQEGIVVPCFRPSARGSGIARQHPRR